MPATLDLSLFIANNKKPNIATRKLHNLLFKMRVIHPTWNGKDAIGWFIEPEGTFNLSNTKGTTR